MKLNRMLTVMALFSITNFSTAHAQSKSGNGTIDGDYNDYVTLYESFLPDCSVPAGTTPPEDPTEWINKISFVLNQSLSDAETDFLSKPASAYLRLKAALDAVSVKTANCHDLRSILSSPIANDTLKAIGVLEVKVASDSANELNKGTELYYFSQASVRVVDKAATTVDRHYFLPYRNDWNPRSGFYRYGPEDTTTLAWHGHGHEEGFGRELLDIAASELTLVDRLGTVDPESGIFTNYLGVRDAYLPVAQELVTSVYNALKTNLLIVYKEHAFIELQILKNKVDDYLTSQQTLSFQVQFQDVHNRVNEISRDLKSCSFYGRY